MAKKKNNYKIWREDKVYINLIMGLPCAGCGNNWDDVCAHHKTGGGMGTKAPDWETIPLCNNCHLDIHTSNSFGLHKIQGRLILEARELLVHAGLIEQGEYPKEKQYV
tara:strand:+ start:257 stop:580 length:324 start_codon:yes stop_codon:yes gene_type:complete